MPVGKGDSIPLRRAVLTIGRRESCDIRFPFPNLSELHAELTFRAGCWYLRDLNSTNGVKVNGVRVSAKRLHSGDVITIAKRRFTFVCASAIG
jgi:pSer/pThr/pTyr-binding forkhead associated (FHA) protein